MLENINWQAVLWNWTVLSQKQNSWIALWKVPGLHSSWETEYFDWAFFTWYSLVWTV